MRSPILAAVLAVVLTGPAAGDGPDVLAGLEKVKAARAEVAKAKAAETAAEAEFRAMWADLQKRVADLKLDAPPAPPGPVVPPAPVDPLWVKLKAAYVADTGEPTKKAAAAADLAELFHQAQDLAGDPTLTNVAGLAGKVSAAAKGLAKDQLVNVWAVVKGEMNGAFPVDAPLTADARTSAKALFLRLETAIKEASK